MIISTQDPRRRQNVIVASDETVHITAPTGLPGPPGAPGKDGTSITGSVPTYTLLPDLDLGDAGQGWITTDTGHLWVWNGTEWTDVGPVQGPPGPSGGDYVHVQTIPAAVWTITHDLGYFANVTVVDTQGVQCEGEVDYGPMGTITVTFSAAFAGTAYLS